MEGSLIYFCLFVVSKKFLYQPIVKPSLLHKVNLLHCLQSFMHIVQLMCFILWYGSIAWFEISPRYVKEIPILNKIADYCWYCQFLYQKSIADCPILTPRFQTLFYYFRQELGRIGVMNVEQHILPTWFLHNWVLPRNGRSHTDLCLLLKSAKGLTSLLAKAEFKTCRGLNLKYRYWSMDFSINC